MTFEETQAVWNTQKNRAIYQAWSKEISRRIVRRSTTLRRAVLFEEFIFIFTCLFFPWLNGFYSGEYWYETIGAAMYGGVALFVLRGSILRRRHEKTFEATVLGDLDRALFRVKCQIWRAKNVLYWFLLPTMAYTALSLTQHFRWPGFLAVLVGYPVCFLLMRFGWKRACEAERESLDSLRTELVELTH